MSVALGGGDRAGRLALVTVTYNSAPVLDEFLASLDAQTSFEWDLIIIDNASTDASVAQVEGWRGPLHALVRNPVNVGFGAATNQGIRLALDAGYGAVVIINNDVTFAPDFLERLAESPARDGTAVLAPVVRYASRPDRFWYAGGDFTWLRGAFQARMFETPPADGRESWPATFAPGCCLLVERVTLERVGLFDEQFFVYWEDVDWAYRCLKAGQPITVVREPVLDHKVSILTGGGTSSFGARMFHEGQVRFLRKHLPRWLRGIQYPLMLGKIAMRRAARRDGWPETRLRLQAIGAARRLPRPTTPPKVAVNLTALGPELVGGTARYAVSLFEAMARAADGRADIALEGYVQPEAERHFSPAARRFLVPTPALANRAVRVVYERLGLPFRLRRRGVHAIVNPIFAGPTRGARRAVTIIHDLYFRTVPHLVEPRRRRYLGLVVPRAVRESHVVVAISESTAQEVRSAWPGAADKVVVVHSAGRELPPGPAMTCERPFLLFVGAVLPNKNVGVIVEALARLRAARRDVELVHIGADPGGLLAAAARASGVVDFVSSPRASDDAGLAAAYRGAVALVVGSVAEGFCLPVLEAQSLGTPVCTTPCGALREVAGDAALYFDPDRPDVLADHIDALLNEPARRAALSKAGRANAERFSWDRTAVAVLGQALGSVSAA
jgi:GT2 family glycosyltransferase/glycosyltransferase involved in cell wall biosynthesis